MSSLHISIAAEPVFHIFGVPISNSILTSWIISVLLVIFVVTLSSNLKLKGKLGKAQLMMELMVESLYNLVESIAGTAKTKLFFPLVATFFFFIVPSNWSGLLPGAGSIGFNTLIEGKEMYVRSFVVQLPTLIPPSRSPSSLCLWSSTTALSFLDLVISRNSLILVTQLTPSSVFLSSSPS